MTNQSSLFTSSYLFKHFESNIHLLSLIFKVKNISYDILQNQVFGDLETLKHFVIQYHNDYGFDMTTEWDYSWTLAKSLLFTVTIMTTVGKLELS